MSDPTKGRAITDLLQPSNATGVRRFLCNLLITTLPLPYLFMIENLRTWSERQQRAFDTVKNRQT